MAACQIERRLVRLPRAFYWDHVSRDLPSGLVVRDCQKHVVVEITEEDWTELRSDAEHYAHSMADGGFDDAGLCQSAFWTVVALDKVDWA